MEKMKKRKSVKITNGVDEQEIYDKKSEVEKL
jgi:hypothetical protein